MPVSKSSSAAYKDRFVKYTSTYVESLPDMPDPMDMVTPPGSAGGAQKTALARNARYNDPKAKQSTNVTGGSNAKK